MQTIKENCFDEIAGKVKPHSSKWVKTKDPSLRDFYWQDGYGAFSVNPADAGKVITYIANQQARHQNKSFKDE